MRTPALVLVSLVLLAIGVTSASAATPARTVRLISGGTSSADSAFAAGISADGSRTIFTTAESLLPADVNGVTDVYARDADGTLQLVSSGKGTSPASFSSVSADGDRVIYVTANAELPTDTDAPPQNDLYERRRNGSLRQISAGNGASGVGFVAQSADGDHVIFASNENIPGTGDSDGQQDFFDRRADGSFRLLTPGTPGVVPIFSGSVALSNDGATAYFVALDSLSPADINAGFDSYSVPTAGGPYTLLTSGGAAGGLAFPSGDGAHAWFSTSDALVPADTDTAADVYDRRADGTFALISGGTANTTAGLVTAFLDGSVIFTTAEKLLPADADATGADLYERKPDGALRLLSGGTTADGANLVGVVADGTAVFWTVESLLPADGDALLDVYARHPDGTLTLVTPSTPASALVSSPGSPIPYTRARVLFDGPDLPGTGDTNGVADTYEITADGPRVLASAAAGARAIGGLESADGSRILFTTTSTIAGTGDSDTASDVYEADFAVPVLNGVPTVSGNGRAGSTQTCNAPTATGEGLTVTTSWRRDSATIAGATAKTYKPVPADAAHKLSCRVTARNGIGADTADSAGRKVPPAARSPKLGGFPILGTKLSCTSFAGATKTTYRWKRGSTTVRGRTGRTYKVGRSDLGKRVTCSAKAKNGSLSTSLSQKVTVPRLCTVPLVRGLTPAAAKTKLGNAGCRSKTKRVTGSGVAVGLVLGTSPAKGKKRPNGSTVTINVRR